VFYWFVWWLACFVVCLVAWLLRVGCHFAAAIASATAAAAMIAAMMAVFSVFMVFCWFVWWLGCFVVRLVAWLLRVGCHFAAAIASATAAAAMIAATMAGPALRRRFCLLTARPVRALVLNGTARRRFRLRIVCCGLVFMVWGWFGIGWRAPARSSVLRCVPARSSVLRCVPARSSVLRCVPVRFGSVGVLRCGWGLKHRAFQFSVFAAIGAGFF